VGIGFAGLGVGVWFLSPFKPGDVMNNIDLIIDALAYARACIGRQLMSKVKLEHNLDKLHNALEAARELKDELYAKEMEQPTPTQSGTISITVNKGLEADIDLLWQVNSADIAALEDAKATFEILKNKAPLKYQSMIYQSLALISKALDMSHSDAFQRIIDKARGNK
jgi:chlorite dismutase